MDYIISTLENLAGQRMSMREYFGCALMLAAVILSQLPQKSGKAVESGKQA